MSTKKKVDETKKVIEKEDKKFDEFKEEIEENTEVEIHIKSSGGKAAFKLYGETMEICNVLTNCFEANEKFYDMVKASVNAFEDAKKFKEMKMPDQLKELGRLISELGEKLN